MDVELQATCSALGYLEGNVYVKEPDCLETVKDLIRFLRRDSDTCDIRRQLGHAKIVANDLIPLFKTYHADKTLFETVVKLLVNLTQPVAACFNNQIPDEKTLRNFCLEIETHLQDTKEAFVDDELFGVLADKIKDILQLDWDRRREEDYLQLERLFILVRNVLMIPPDPGRELRTDDDATIHDQILWASHTSGLEDLLLYVASSDRERSRLCMHVMEIISLMFREQEVETLAFAGVQRSMTEKEKDQRELEKAREKEKAMKKANILKYSARHSRFGGTFVMKNVKSITESNVIYHKPLCEVDRFSYDEGKVPKKKSKNLAPVKTLDNKRRSTLSMRLSLKEFCVQFLMNAYNPLMRAVKDALTRSRSDDHDETYYLWAMRYFMEFCRLHCKRVDLVSETMSMAAFHYIYIQLCNYYENVAMGKAEEAKAWGRRSHLALKAYQELLKTLDSMTKSNDEQIRESAKVMQSNVFYMMEYRDIFVTLLKKFKESKSSRSYLRDLVESTHIFLKMLETFSKGSRNLVVQKKGKSQAKKKKPRTQQNSQQDTPPQMSEEELVVMWDGNVSEQVMTMLQGNEDIPTDVLPFDAASEVSMDEQRVEAMLRIQSSLRSGHVGESVAVLRAAREVWPEGDVFGSDTGQAEDEIDSLRTIFMADLPRPASQAAPEEEGGDDIEDEVNEELQDEMDDVRRDEHCFDFKVFISDFAHPHVIKAYATLLNEFPENSDAVNHCIIKLLHRLGHDLGYVGMMFQASIFNTFSKIFFGPLAKLERYKELRTFACWVVRQFTQVASVNNKVYVDILFWKTKVEALAITGDYDFRPKSKAKVVWSEHDADELACLYEKYKDMVHAELDTVELILQELTSDHSRMQVLRELKNQGLIVSAKDVKRKNVRKSQWTEEHIQELRDAVELHREADHPIAAIMEKLSFDRKKPSVVKKIVELGLVGDKSQLKRKPGTKRGGSGGGRKKGGDSSSDDDGDDSSDDDDGGDSSSSGDSGDDEGRRLFPDTDRRDKKKKHSKKSNNANDDDDDDDDDDDGDGDYREGDSDDDDVDEDVMLLVRQSASGVGDYVMRLVEHGYKNQIAWIQTCLRNVAEDRDEGMSMATPLVPLTEENETAMEDDIFLIFLRSIGITPPSNEQEMFWRIPKEFTASDLCAIVEGLNHDESGMAVNADAAQAVVARVFPKGVAGPSKAKAKQDKKEQKKKDKEERRKKKKEEKRKEKERKRASERKEKKNKKSDKSKGKDVKKSKKKNANDDGDTEDIVTGGNSNSNSDNDEDLDISEVLNLPGVGKKDKDADTSDSGLDPEIEMEERKRMKVEKKGEKKGVKGSKGKLTSKKERNDLLKKIQEKRNKRKRKDNDDGGAASSRLQSEPVTADASHDDDEGGGGEGPGMKRLSGRSPNLQDRSGADKVKMKKNNKGKRLKFLDSDSDSDMDINLNLSTEAHSDKEDGDDNNSDDASPLTGRAGKKRILESESESETELVDKEVDGKKKKGLTELGDGGSGNDDGDDGVSRRRLSKGSKRLKMILSDDEDGESDRDGNQKDGGGDDEDDDVVNKESSPAHKDVDSDKENLVGGLLCTPDKADLSSNTLDESLHLHFEDSSEEEEKKEDDDVNEDDDKGNEKVTCLGKDSFPATMMSQTLGSDEEDDHVPLRAVINKRKAVISDDEDD